MEYIPAPIEEYIPAPIDIPNPIPPVEPEGPHTLTTIGQDGEITTVNMNSESSTLPDGRAMESITVPADLAERILEDGANGSTQVDISLASFDSPNAQQPVIEVTIPSEVLAASTGMTISLTTPHGTLSLPPELVDALAAAGQPLDIIIDRQPAETVQDLIPAGTEPLGQALSVDTALAGATKVSILVDIELPADAALRQAYLNSLMTFAIHSSGTQEMIYDVAYDVEESVGPDGQITYTLHNVSFWVDEFSRFIVVKPNWELLSTTVGTPGYTIAGVTRNMVSCYYKGNDTYMPIRMLEDFGVNLAWDEGTQTATMTYKQNTVVLTIGSTDAYINGVKTPIVGASGALAAPELSPGRTMIPLRFVSEHLGFNVTWDPSNLITIRLDPSTN